MMLLKEHIVSSYRSHIACDLVLFASASMMLLYNIINPAPLWQMLFWMLLGQAIILLSSIWLWRDVRDYLVIRKALKNWRGI